MNNFSPGTGLAMAAGNILNTYSIELNNIWNSGVNTLNFNGGSISGSKLTVDCGVTTNDLSLKHPNMSAVAQTQPSVTYVYSGLTRPSNLAGAYAGNWAAASGGSAPRPRHGRPESTAPWANAAARLCFEVGRPLILRRRAPARARPWRHLRRSIPSGDAPSESKLDAAPGPSSCRRLPRA